MRDLHNNIDAVIALNSVEITSDTTTNGAIIDLKGLNSIEFIVQSGAITDGDYLFSVEVGESADLSDGFSTFEGLLGGEISFTSADSNKIKKIGYIGNKRYLRLSIFSSNTSSGGFFSAIAIGNPLNLPVA